MNCWGTTVLACSLVVGLGSTALVGVHASDEKPAATVPAKSDVRQRKVSPRPTSAAEARLRAVAWRLKPGIVMLESSATNGGTGFVVSRKHRLIATAGHVADSFFIDRRMYGVLDGTETRVNVTRVWYHPGTVRVLDSGLEARSFDTEDGEISDRSPDLAVLQLSKAGPEFPCELELASDEDLRTLDGQPAGVLGYPVLDGSTLVEYPPVRAHFAMGVIGGTVDEFENADLPFGKRHVLQTSARLGGGSSGAPVFLSNGRVAGIFNRTHGFDAVSDDLVPFYAAEPAPLAPPPSESDFRGRADRIDLLRELLAYHKLSGYAPMTDADLNRRRDWGPDPSLDRFRKAVALVRDARALIRKEQYADAAGRCCEAITLAPNYAAAFLVRSVAYLWYVGSQWDALKPKEVSSYAEAAFEDSYRCLEKYRWSYARLIHAQNTIYVAHLRPEHSWFRGVVADMDEMIRGDLRYPALTAWEASFAHNCRAQCHAFLGEAEIAQTDYAKSIELAPDEPRWYINRADFWDKNGHADLAKADRLKAKELRASRKAG